MVDRQCSCVTLRLMINPFTLPDFNFFSRATNIENGEMNQVKNLTTGAYGGVPDTARAYKVTFKTWQKKC